MATNYIQEGKALNYTPSGADVASGDFLVIGAIGAVAKTDIADGKTGAVHICGVFSVAKASGAITQGALLYWDNTAENLTTTATDNTLVGVTTYACHIKQLEEERILIEEKIKKCGTVDISFEEVNRTAKKFLASPYDFWEIAGLLGKRLVLKATFARPVAYSKKEGYRTPALSQPFSVLAGFYNRDSGLVVGNGLGANQIVDFIDALNDMGRVFENPPGLDGKSFKFEPLALAA